MSRIVQLVKKRFGELSDIQKLAIPRILKGENVLITAPTGSGKTEAALLPVLEKIEKEQKGICALYITPLKALNRDLMKRFAWWCGELGISYGVRHGDTTQYERAKQRKDPPKILLVTIESVGALLVGRVMREHLKNIKFVIVDEIHDVLDNKRGAQLSLLIERLEGIADFRRIALSATLADESEAAKLAFGDRKYSYCEAGKKRELDISVEDIKSHDKRVERILRLLEESRALVFVNTRSSAEEIGASIKKANPSVDVHHGSLAKNVRISAEDRFKNGEISSLLCTSSLELGIDIGDVDLVVQYGSPHQVFRLVQRVGRSGHSLSGVPRGVLLCTDFDDYLESTVLSILAKNGEYEEKKVEKGAYDVIAHEIVGLLLEYWKLDLSKIHRILSRSYAYGISFEELRRIALQLYSEGLIFYDEAENGEIFIKPKRKARDYYFQHLSTIPKSKRFILRNIITNRKIASLDEDFVVSLESGVSFLAKGTPWVVEDITDEEVLASPSAATEITIPAWQGEDIPVASKVARLVGSMRKKLRKKGKVPDAKNAVVEIVGDLIIIHACFGTRVNNSMGRIVSSRLSRILGESVRSVVDPYRIFIKLPFPLQKKHIREVLLRKGNIRFELEESLRNSPLLRFKFTHTARLFGLLSIDGSINQRFIDVMRHSPVYQETIRSIFSRYFDVALTEKIMGDMRNGRVALDFDEREKPGFFSDIGLKRLGKGAEAVGDFEPRETAILALKEKVLSKLVRLLCLNCGYTRYLYIATAPDSIKCDRCGLESITLVQRENQSREELGHIARLISAHGKKAIIALSVYGVGPGTAERVLKRLHPEEKLFYLDLIERQKQFVKTKKFWKP